MTSSKKSWFLHLECAFKDRYFCTFLGSFYYDKYSEEFMYNCTLYLCIIDVTHINKYPTTPLLVIAFDLMQNLFHLFKSSVSVVAHLFLSYLPQSLHLLILTHPYVIATKYRSLIFYPSWLLTFPENSRWLDNCLILSHEPNL